MAMQRISQLEQLYMHFLGAETLHSSEQKQTEALGPPGHQFQAEKPLVDFWACSLPCAVPSALTRLTLMVAYLLFSCFSLFLLTHFILELTQDCPLALLVLDSGWLLGLLAFYFNPKLEHPCLPNPSHRISPPIFFPFFYSLIFWISPSPPWVYILGFGRRGGRWTRLAEHSAKLTLS